MRRALLLARRGIGKVHPNPLVGAVLVHQGKIIGEGAHEQFGGPHAEVAALARWDKAPLGSTLYSTLEPCAHFGKTPPCVNRIIDCGVSKVVLGAYDANPRVCRKGARALRRAGVKVEAGILEYQARQLNKDFDHWIRYKTPYGVMKLAVSLDGKITKARGKWITGKAARLAAHELRLESDAILVGVHTVLKDNPRLNVRLKGAKSQPLKIVLDSRLRTPLNARLFSGGGVLVATTGRAPKNKIKKMSLIAEVLVLPEKAGGVSIAALLKELGKMGIVRLLVEGGALTARSFIRAGAVQEAVYFVAPIVAGAGQIAAPLIPLKNPAIRVVGRDLMIRGEI